jgi:hypothetical protein
MRGFVAAALLGGVFLGGCGSIGSFDVDLPADGEIPGAAVVTMGSQFTAYGSASSTISEAFTNKGVKPGEFQSAEISAGFVSVPQSEATSLAHIQSFEIDVAAPGLPTVAIAQQSTAAFAAKPTSGMVNLEVEKVELKPYLTAASVTFTAKPVFTSPPPPTAVPLHVDLTLHVQVL